MARPLVEVCLEGIESARAAVAGGADRLELCEYLASGGVTPSGGAISACVELGVPVHVLVRPRPGGFVYSSVELDVIRRDVELAAELGASGVVVGALDEAGRIDLRATEALVRVARPMSVTFHRAFDQALDAEESLDVLANLGVDRVLTSGQAPDAGAGAERLADWTERYRGRLTILVGGGITIDRAADVAQRSGATELHVGSAVTRASGIASAPESVPLGPGGSAAEARRPQVAAELVEELLRRLSS